MSSETATAGSPSGVIHDIGYRTYTGDRVGRLGIVRALYWHSLRSAWGLGRGPRAKIVPFMALVIMCLPAIANAFAVSRTGVHAIRYDEYMYSFQLVLVLYLAAVTPELISRDIRNRTLPLYFSRPLRRTDYPIAKVSALITAMLVLTAIPELLLYVGTIGSLHGGSAVWAETRAFIPGLELALLYSVVFSVLAAVLSCYTGRRAFATGAVAVFFFGSWVISSALVHLTGFRPHYHHNADGSGYFVNPDSVGAGPKASGLLSPANLLEGLKEWIVGRAPKNPDVPYPGGFGVAYLAVVVVLCALAFLLLIRRYQKASLL
ncbi:ABC-2 type transport system permease protein [Catenulispora sp. MAP12-49]|jgi:ABC-2 type transport system permease protein|uniref:ABC transporter permease n=1 Tax=unclassified Catenulispora TaxID=414885 RepID=UPI0035183246